MQWSDEEPSGQIQAFRPTSPAAIKQHLRVTALISSNAGDGRMISCCGGIAAISSIAVDQSPDAYVLLDGGCASRSLGLGNEQPALGSKRDSQQVGQLIRKTCRASCSIVFDAHPCALDLKPSTQFTLMVPKATASMCTPP